MINLIKKKAPKRCYLKSWFSTNFKKNNNIILSLDIYQMYLRYYDMSYSDKTYIVIFKK